MSMINMMRPANLFRLILLQQAMVKMPSASTIPAKMLAFTTSFTNVKSLVC